MDQRSLLTSSLTNLTAGWRPALSTTTAALSEARAAIARSVLAGRQATAPGDALHAVFPAGAALPPEIAPIVDRVLGEPATAPPLAFVRDLPATEGLARTVPAWANGMAATHTYGPFLDAAGAQRFVDLITVRKTFAVVRAPTHAPLCLLQIDVPLVQPTAPTVTGSLGAGSLWLVVRAFVPAAPADAFAGLAFSHGKVTITGLFSVANDVITLSAGAKLMFELAPISAPAPANRTGAGGDFRNSSLTLPASVTFTFAPNGNALTAMAAATLDAYGSAQSYAHQTSQALYNAPLALLAFPCIVTPSTFIITQRTSTVFELGGNATVVAGAYALPVAVTTPQSLGAAASGGYLSLALGGGLAAAVNDNATPTPFTGVVLLRTSTALVIFAQTAVAETERYDLWDGRNASASSLEATIAAGATIVFVAGDASELTLEDAAIVALLDRPIAATGNSLPIVFANALVVVLLAQAPADLLVFAAGGSLAVAEFPLALENAYLAVSQPTVLELFGRLQARRVTRGGLALVLPLARALPTCPDPYLATYAQDQRRIPGTVSGSNVIAAVFWTTPASAALSFTMLQQAQAAELPAPADMLKRAASRGEGFWGFDALLDVSTNADLLGVFILETAGALGFDGISLATQLDRVLLLAVPQISWEPLLSNDTWGFVSQDDGIPALMLARSAQPVRIEPAVLFDSEIPAANANGAQAAFTLPFGIEAQIDTSAAAPNPPPLPSFQPMRPTFSGARGGRQLAIVAGNIGAVNASLPGSAAANSYGLGVLNNGDPNAVGNFFNQEFSAPPTGKEPRVPVSRYDMSGYGASLFSDWFATDADPAVGIATARFEVSVGRTLYEVVQAKSYIYHWGIPVVETVTMVRQPDGSVVRVGTGWRAIAPGAFDFGNKTQPPPPPPVPNVPAAQIQKGPLVGLFNIRNIQPTGETTTVTSVNGMFTYEKVLFDADVRITDADSDPNGIGIVTGAVKDGSQISYFPSRGITGWLQTSVGSLSTIFELELLLQQTGPVAGPLAGVVDVGRNGTQMTLTQFEASLSPNAAAGPSIVAAVRGTPHLPRDGAWSVSKRIGASPPTALDPQSPVPLVRPNGTTPWQMAEPAEVGAAATQTFYGLLQSTGTQKSLYEAPQIAPGGSGYTFPQVPNLADVGALLGLSDVFPDLGSALKPPSFSGLDTSQDGLKTTIAWRIGSQPGDASLIHPGRKLLDFGPVKVFLEFTSDPTANPPPAQGSAVTLVLDPTASAGPDGRWSFKIEGLCSYVLVDGASSEFDPLLYISGDFFVSEKASPTFRNLNVQFGSAMSIVQTILTALTDIASSLPGGGGEGLTVTFAGSTLSISEGFTLPTIPLGFGEIENVGMNLGSSINLLQKQLSFQVGIGSPDAPVTWSFFPLAGNGCVVVAANQNGLGVIIQAGLGIGLTIDVAVASGSASIIFAVQVDTTGSTFDIKAMLIGNAQVDVLGGVASASLTLTAALDIKPEGGGNFDLTASVAVAIHISICWVVSVDFDGSWSMEEQLSA
jgi:hypothetical protein